MDMSQLKGLNIQEMKDAVLTLAQLADAKMLHFSEPAGVYETEMWYRWRDCRNGLLSIMTDALGSLEEAEMNKHKNMGEGK